MRLIRRSSSYGDQKWLADIGEVEEPMLELDRLFAAGDQWPTLAATNSSGVYMQRTAVFGSGDGIPGASPDFAP